MDTVFKEGAAKQNPFRVDEDGNAHGPGVLDMKAGLTIAVFIVKALNDAGYNERPVKIAFAGDEENGHRESGAAAVMLEACEGVAAAFNFETGYLDDGLVVGRKGSFRMTVEVQGVASHSGNAPEKGRNAILEMSHKIIELQNLNDYEHGTSLNVGLITGGTVVNAVPDHCEIKIDIRFTQKERLDQLLEKIDEVTVLLMLPLNRAKTLRTAAQRSTLWVSSLARTQLLLVIKTARMIKRPTGSCRICPVTTVRCKTPAITCLPLTRIL